ncbi:hypothetical protein CEXT_248291, partial [Caerostris extrusa]
NSAVPLQTELRSSAERIGRGVLTKVPRDSKAPELFLGSTVAATSALKFLYLNQGYAEAKALFAVHSKVIDENNTKIYSPTSFFEEKKAHSVTVFFEREERRAQMLSEETRTLFLERGDSSETETY